MKYFLTIILVFILTLVYGQRKEYFLLIQDTSIFQTKVAAFQDRLGLDILSETRNTPALKRIFHIDSIYLDDANLNFDFQLEPQGKEFYWDFNIALKTVSQDSFMYPPINEIEGDFRNVFEEQKNAKRIQWLDVIENRLEYQQEYTLFIKANLYGTVDCSGDRPAFFKPTEQWPHFVAFSLAAVSFYGSYRLNQSAKNDYNRYTNQWINGASQTEATPFLDKAGDDQKSSDFFSNVGFLILGIQAVILGNRYFNSHKTAKKNYLKYCQNLNNSNQLTLEPDAAMTLSNGKLSLPAIKLRYTF